MRAAVLLIALIALPAVASEGREWTLSDTGREATYVALHVADWGQSLDLRPEYSEGNWVLGKRPTRDAVNAYWAGTLVLHAAVSYALPRPYRAYWQFLTIGMEGVLVWHNWQIGVRMSF